MKRSLPVQAERALNSSVKVRSMNRLMDFHTTDGQSNGGSLEVGLAEKHHSHGLQLPKRNSDASVNV